MTEKRPEGHKSFAIYIPETLFFELITRLQFDELSRRSFIKEVIKLYVDKDEDFYKVLDKVKDKVSKQQKRRRGIISKLRKKEKEYGRKFFLDKEETERLYDILEKDLPPDDLD